MNVNGVAKAGKNLLQEQRLCSHGVVRIIRQGLPDEFILAEEKLKTAMPSFDLFEKVKNPHPTNLTNELQRIKYSGEEVREILRQNPELSRTVGSLPQKWGRRVGKDQIFRDGIDDTFAEFAEKFHRHNYTQKDIDFMQLKLSAILGTDVKISYLGQGYYGKTFRIHADSQDYVLKVFYQNNSYGENAVHGNFPELASAIYAGKNEADKFTTFYMGRFGKNNDGYILTKYIPETSPKIRYVNGINENSGRNFVFSKFLRKVEIKDPACGNKLGKKFVDFGDMVSNDSINLEPQTYILAKMIGKCLDTGNSKELEKIISKHQHKKEFKQAVGFLQDLINKNCTSKNYKILESKKELLEKLGLDFVPDIRYILSNNKGYAESIKNNTGLDTMYGISYKAFADLWEKYNKILQNIQKH